MNDPEGPFLCQPKIWDVRTDITTQALEEAGWTVTVNEQEENFKIQDLERKIFTPHRNRVMCEAFLRQCQRGPDGEIGKSIIFAVNQNHATALTKILNDIKPGTALTITSRIPDSSSFAKEFRDGKRAERVAVSVDMLSTGYNCRDLLNVVLMRPIFSPTEYIQIKGRGTRLYKFVIGNTEYDKKWFFLLDFCGVAAYFEDTYDYTVPLTLPRPKSEKPGSTGTRYPTPDSTPGYVKETGTGQPQPTDRQIPVWEGTDRVVSQEVRIVGPSGEKVDVMTFRGTFERDLKEFAADNDEFSAAVEAEDDDTIETVMQEGFYHKPAMYYSPDKLVVAYGVPAPTPAFVYNALGRRPLPTKEAIIGDTVDSIAARFNLRYSEQKWLNATAELVADDPQALDKFLRGDHTIFHAGQFVRLGGLQALSQFTARDAVFEALRQTSLVRQSAITATASHS